MAKNQLNFTQRFELQNWIKKMSHAGFDGAQNIDEIIKMATTAMGYLVVKSHIRRNAALLNIRLPRSHKEHSGSTRFAVRKSFTCECGRSYSVGIYPLKTKVGIYPLKTKEEK